VTLPSASARTGLLAFEPGGDEPIIFLFARRRAVRAQIEIAAVDAYDSAG
jgi:hypothetical protein